ncbi:MAG: hypothetical protein J5666_06000 [Bacilli bacterium]|nr:hypothetical protein [Bacilli bacterium]
MISKKELQYVNAWESKAPFPGTDYAKATLEQMQRRYEEYNEKLRGKSFGIIFNDASECEFEIFEQNVSHLLGINYKWLTDGAYDGFIKDVLGLDPEVGFSSYTLLTKIIEHQDDVIAHDRQSSLRLLNYYKSLIKSSIFRRIGTLEEFNFGKIDLGDNAKLLYMPSSEAVCPFFFVLVDKDKNDEFASKHYVKSLLSPSREEMSNYFHRAEGKPVIPTQIIVDDMDNLRKTVATPKDKLDMLSMHEKISQIAGEAITVDPDYDYVVTLMENQRLQEKVKQLQKTLNEKR